MALTELRAMMLDRMAEGALATGDLARHVATVAWFGERLADGDTHAAYVIDVPGGGVVACATGVVGTSGAPIPGIGRALTGEVSTVVTRPEVRGRGHARACVEAVLAWMDGLGVARAGLSATPDGESLYRSLGFTTRPWTPMWRH